MNVLLWLSILSRSTESATPAHNLSVVTNDSARYLGNIQLWSSNSLQMQLQKLG